MSDTWEKCINSQTGAIQYRRDMDLVYLEPDGWHLFCWVRAGPLSRVCRFAGPFFTAMLAMMEG
jgi:hypothetical protein